MRAHRLTFSVSPRDVSPVTAKFAFRERTKTHAPLPQPVWLRGVEARIKYARIGSEDPNRRERSGC